MLEKATLEKLFKDRGFPDFKWIEAKDIVVARWVRFRCMFGCPAYGKRGTCPPNVPSIDECRQMISEYNQVAVFHFEKKLEKPVDRKDVEQTNCLETPGARKRSVPFRLL